jgi:hypothetical protein
MAVLTTEFDIALSRIEPSDADKENAPDAHEQVRAVLKDDSTLARYVIEPVLIGSYKRRVSILRVKDVDVCCRLEELSADVTPEALLEHFDQVLTVKYGAGRVTKQARSVQVAFPEFDGLYVDAVPARPVDGVWEIPQHESNDWQRTNPEELTILSSSMNRRHDDLYVATVKLLRQTRRTLLGKRPGGLFVELALTTHATEGWSAAGTTLSSTPARWKVPLCSSPSTLRVTTCPTRRFPARRCRSGQPMQSCKGRRQSFKRPASRLVTRTRPTTGALLL